MVDESILDEMVEHAIIFPGDVVLEIGAGYGNLTEKIAEKGKLSAIEKEPDLVSVLRRKFANDGGVDIISGDALIVEYPIYNKVISNMPYSISRKLTERIITEGFVLAVLVVQDEFAKKLDATPGAMDYRMISVLVQSTCDIELLRNIPPQAFRPQPRVESHMIRLRQTWKPGRDYIEFLNRLFSQKNKKLSNIIEVDDDMADERPGSMPAEAFRSLYLKSSGQ